jgi:hypothetical protein
MADKTPEDVRAHNQRLIDGGAYMQAMKAMRQGLAQAYPHLAKAGPLFEGVVEVAVSENWRRQRCFHHLRVEMGARTPDGEAGYTLSFYADGNELTSSLMRITLTRAELGELALSVMKELENGN